MAGDRQPVIELDGDLVLVRTPQTRIWASGTRYLVLGPVVDDLACLQDHDVIGPCRDRLAMRDHQGGAAELMDGTDWDDYGVGKYEKCANCMVHCGFEGTAAADSMRRPVEFLKVALGGVRTEGPMAPDIDLSKQRRAADVHLVQVEAEMERIKVADPEGFRRASRVAA